MRIQFRGYAADCTVNGQLEVSDTRLSDMLSRAEHIAVENAVLDSLDGTRSVPAGLLLLQRDELHAVDAGPGAGDPQRRVRTVRHMLRLNAGPYVIFGEMHARPGADALRFFHTRRGFVPLTDCHVIVRSESGATVDTADVLVVNSELVDALNQTTQADMQAELAMLRQAIEAPTDTSLPTSEAPGIA
jgi:hypothetical protein